MTSYTWNNANWFDAATWTLSAANKTATRAGASGVIPIKTNESFASGVVQEKFTFTTYNGAAGAGGGGIGLVNGAWSNSSSGIGADVNSVLLSDDGTGKFNNVALGSGARLPSNVGFTSGGSYWIEVDYSAKTIRFSADGATWGNTTDITSLIVANGTLYFATWGYYAGQVVTLSEPVAASGAFTLLLMGVG